MNINLANELVGWWFTPIIYEGTKLVSPHLTYEEMKEKLVPYHFTDMEVDKLYYGGLGPYRNEFLISLLSHLPPSQQNIEALQKVLNTDPLLVKVNQLRKYKPLHGHTTSEITQEFITQARKLGLDVSFLSS